jgi:hypothetical protein
MARPAAAEGAVGTVMEEGAAAMGTGRAGEAGEATVGSRGGPRMGVKGAEMGAEKTHMVGAGGVTEEGKILMEEAGVAEAGMVVREGRATGAVEEEGGMGAGGEGGEDMGEGAHRVGAGEEDMVAEETIRSLEFRWVRF